MAAAQQALPRRDLRILRFVRVAHRSLDRSLRNGLSISLRAKQALLQAEDLFLSAALDEHVRRQFKLDGHGRSCLLIERFVAGLVRSKLPQQLFVIDADRPAAATDNVERLVARCPGPRLKNLLIAASASDGYVAPASFQVEAP